MDRFTTTTTMKILLVVAVAAVVATFVIAVLASFLVATIHPWMMFRTPDPMPTRPVSTTNAPKGARLWLSKNSGETLASNGDTGTERGAQDGVSDWTPAPTGQEVGGVAVAGTLAGLILVGPCFKTLVLGVGAAAVAATDGPVGKFTRSLGDAVAMAGRYAQGLHRKHNHLLDKVKAAMAKVWSNMKRLLRNATFPFAAPSNTPTADTLSATSSSDASSSDAPLIAIAQVAGTYKWQLRQGGCSYGRWGNAGDGVLTITESGAVYFRGYEIEKYSYDEKKKSLEWSSPQKAKIHFHDMYESECDFGTAPRNTGRSVFLGSLKDETNYYTSRLDFRGFLRK